MNPILDVQGIKKSYGNKAVLTDVHLTMGRGELVGITGENGCGKSTILKVLLGVLKPDAGKVQINGSIGYCPQETILFPQLTVLENFKYFGAAYDINSETLKERLDYFTSYFRFEKFLNDKVENLSGGTKQKVNLCLALLNEPELLILDEPYNGFDWNTYNFFWEYAKSLKDKNCSVLIVAHLLTNTEIFNSVYELKDGVLV